MDTSSKEFQLGRHQWVLPTVLLALSIVVLTIGITADLRRAKHAIELQTKFISKACEENMNREMQLVSRLFRSTREQLAFIRTWRQEDERALAALLSGQQAASSYIDGLILVDDKGVVRATNRGRKITQDSLLKLDVADEDYFKPLKNMSAPSLHIGRPTEIFKDQHLRVPIAQALFDRDKNFVGALIAILDPKGFADFFSSLELGATASMAILREDGYLVMRQPQPPDLAFVNPLFSKERMTSEISGKAERFFEERSPADGELRVGFYRKMAGLPLVTFVSLSQAEALANWRRDAVGMALIVIVLNLAVAAFSFFLTKSKFDRERDQVKMIEQQELMSTMQEKVADKTGLAFFESLANCLGSSLGVRVAAVIRIISHEHLQRKPLAISVNGSLDPSHSLEILASAMEKVVWNGQLFIGNSFRDFLGNADFENTAAFESFCGVPVNLSNGSVAGVLFVADSKPIERLQFVQLVLSVFAPRVGAELERAMAEESRMATEEFRAMVSEQVRQAQKSETSAALTASFVAELSTNLDRLYSLLNRGSAHFTLPDSRPIQAELLETLVQQKSLIDRITGLVTQKQNVEESVMALDLINSAMSLVRATVAQEISIQSEIEIDQSTHFFGDKATLKQLLFGMSLRCALESKGSKSEKNWMRLVVKELSLDEVLELGFEPKQIADRYIWFLLHGSLSEIAAIQKVAGTNDHELKKDREMQLQMAEKVVVQHGGVFLQGSKANVELFCQFILPSQAKLVLANTIHGERKDGSKKILIVDDEQDLLTVICDLLGHYGYLTKGFSDSEEALKEFRQNPYAYDLVITDLSMPGLGGDVLAEQIMAQRTDLPILLCSGYNQKLSDEKAKQIGINMVIQKPFEFEEMVRTVHELLSRSS